MYNIEMLLPQFAEMVLYCTKKNKTKPRVIFSVMAFTDDECKLMGSAIKYCSLKHISVSVAGTGTKESVDLDPSEYGIYDVEALGEKVRKLAKKHNGVNMKSNYLRICESCGATLYEDDENKDAVSFVRDLESGTLGYYTKKGNSGEAVPLSLDDVKRKIDKVISLDDLEKKLTQNVK